MSDLRKAAEKALDALLHAVPCTAEQVTEQDEAINSLRAALAEPEQSEPCLYLDPNTGETWTVGAIEDGCRHVDGLIALFDKPPRREPLSDEQVKKATGAGDEYWASSKLFIVAIARAIEQAHGITGEKT